MRRYEEYIIFLSSGFLNVKQATRRQLTFCGVFRTAIIVNYARFQWRFWNDVMHDQYAHSSDEFHDSFLGTRASKQTRGGASENGKRTRAKNQYRSLRSRQLRSRICESSLPHFRAAAGSRFRPRRGVSGVVSRTGGRCATVRILFLVGNELCAASVVS